MNNCCVINTTVSRCAAIIVVVIGLILLSIPQIVDGADEEISAVQAGIPCGPASMAIALKLLEYPLTNEVLLEVPVASDGTTSFADMAMFAKSRGLYANAVRLSPSQLLRLNAVAILQIHAPLRNDQGEEPLHFVTFAGPIDGKHVLVFDHIRAHGIWGTSRARIRGRESLLRGGRIRGRESF